MNCPSHNLLKLTVMNKKWISISTDFSSALLLPLRKDVTSATCSPEFTAPELIQENLEAVGPQAVSWPLYVQFTFFDLN